MDCWRPQPMLSWNLQLSGTADRAVVVFAHNKEEPCSIFLSTCLQDQILTFRQHNLKYYDAKLMSEGDRHVNPSSCSTAVQYGVLNTINPTFFHYKQAPHELLFPKNGR